MQQFKRRIGSEEGVLYWQFGQVDELMSLLRIHLPRQARAILDSLETHRQAAADTPIGSSATAAVLSSTLEDDGDEGILDLVEHTADQSERAREVVARLGTSFVELNARLEEAVREPEPSTTDQRARVAAYKRQTNRLAAAMTDFTERLRPDIPILSESLRAAIAAYGRAIAILPEFGDTESSRGALVNAQSALQGLNESINPTQGRVETLRATIDRLPRITTQFNRAKREIVALLDSYLQVTAAALNLIPEIDQSITEQLRRLGPSTISPES